MTATLDARHGRAPQALNCRRSLATIGWLAGPQVKPAPQRLAELAAPGHAALATLAGSIAAWRWRSLLKPLNQGCLDMNCQRGRSVCSFVCVIVGLTLAAHAEGPKRPITAKDLMRFTWAADPQIAPDGSRVAFVKVTVDADKDDYVTSIWLAPVPASGQTPEPRRLTNGPRDVAPRWSPDGTRLIFARATEKDGKPQPPQLYLLPFGGGEPRPLTDLPKGASSPAWSPDGKTVAFVSGTTPEDIEKAQRVKKGQKPERESDVRVVRREEFRLDNAGYRDDLHPRHLWTIPVPGAGESPGDNPPEPRRLTSGPVDEADPRWSRDGKQLFFVSDRDLEAYQRPEKTAVYTIPAEGGAIRKVAGIPGMLHDLALCPDGKRIAMRGTLGEPARSYAQPDLYVADTAPGSIPRNITADFDGDIGAGITGDQRPLAAQPGQRQSGAKIKARSSTWPPFADGPTSCRSTSPRERSPS